MKSLTLFFFLGSLGFATDLSETEKIFCRLDSIWLQEPSPKGPAGTNLITSLREDGTWPEIEYDGEKQPGFRAFPHVERMTRIAWDFRAPGESQGRPELSSAYRKTLAAWIRLGLKPRHEWFYTMGVPLSLCRSLVLMRKELGPGDIQGALPLLRVSLREGQYFYGGHPATGANLVWSAGPTLIGALLAGDSAGARHAAEALSREVEITEGEGIQADFSFHQHGPLLYSGGYGGAFIGEMARWAFALEGTRYALPDSKVKILANTLLEGEQFMIRGDAWDYGVVGREISRPGQGARGVHRTARQMAEAWPERKSELEALRARVLEESNAPPLEGNRMFWRSDYMAHARSGFQASVRLSSTRIKGYESGNGENELGYHLGDGAFCLMRDGNEYRTIFPLWNWRQIPGITAPQSEKPLPVLPWGKGSEGGSPFAGGVSDGTRGVAGMILRKDGLEAHKAWFFFGDEILFLGSGIQGAEIGNPVYTTINQCLARGEIVTSRGRLEEGQPTQLTAPAWFLHDSVGYALLLGPEVLLSREKRNGTWKKIQRLTPEGNTPATEEIFSAVLNHGTHPTGGEYAYALLPGAKSGNDFLGSLQQRPMKVQPDLLAASDRTGKILGMIFFEPGKIILPGFPEFTTDRPCAVLLHQEGGRWSGSLSSPSHEVGKVTLSLKEQTESKEKVLELPAGKNKGESTRFEF